MFLKSKTNLGLSLFPATVSGFITSGFCYKSFPCKILCFLSYKYCILNSRPIILTFAYLYPSEMISEIKLLVPISFYLSIAEWSLPTGVLTLQFLSESSFDFSKSFWSASAPLLWTFISFNWIGEHHCSRNFVQFGRIMIGKYLTIKKEVVFQWI